MWGYVYVQTMKDWGLLWKRISVESGQHIRGFINFWAIAALDPMAMDKLEARGKGLLWYAFVNREETNLYDEDEEDISEKWGCAWSEYLGTGPGPDGRG